MVRLCATRLLKNARFLQSPEVSYFPAAEPLEGFQSLIPAQVLMRLERVPLEEIKIEQLARALSRARPPKAGPKLSGPLFSGTLRFVATTFESEGASFAVPGADLKVATDYTNLAAPLVSAYCSQYGPNRLAVAGSSIPFKASVNGGKYNDSMLSGWVDQIASANGLGSDSCLVFLSPQGVVNTDADATQGVLGYHSISSSGVTYSFVNVMGKGLTVRDEQGLYALALSHEIAEMTVDPKADGSNPECCDPCAGNCNVNYANYFDSGGNWLGGVATRAYQLFIDGIATPSTVALCPAPASSCSYPPPKLGGRTEG